MKSENQPQTMENPYIGRDGRDYYSWQDLEQANAVWFKQMYPPINRGFFDVHEKTGITKLLPECEFRGKK